MTWVYRIMVCIAVVYAIGMSTVGAQVPINGTPYVEWIEPTAVRVYFVVASDVEYACVYRRNLVRDPKTYLLECVKPIAAGAYAVDVRGIDYSYRPYEGDEYKVVYQVPNDFIESKWVPIANDRPYPFSITLPLVVK